MGALLETGYPVTGVAMYPYRVFISYSHSDRQMVERLDEALGAAGVVPMWDKHLRPGVGFSEQIQRFITNAHVFLPFFTTASVKRPWLHQEIGFAIALGKPVLPVTLGVTPLGMINGIQAVKLRKDLTDAPKKLSAECFHSLMNGEQDRPVNFECTDDNTQRALLLARYADSVSALDRYGPVRQMASLTTFHLPDRGPGDPVWKKYYHGAPDEPSLFDALRRERIALQRHADKCGCHLILDAGERLKVVYRRHGPASVRARITGLLSFLRDDSVPDVVVAINDDRGRNSSMTLVGDWFSSEAVSSGVSRVLREAIFTRNGPTIRQQILDFDNRMRDLLAARGWHANSSRAKAVSFLQAHLDRMS